jgi:hypothetical protein
MSTGTENNSHFLAAAGTAVVASATLVWLWRRDPPKKFHVPYQVPRFPFIVKLMALLPKSTRKSLAIKVANPKPPTDGVDLVGGDYDPYEEKKELVSDKVWRVRYRYVQDPGFIPGIKMFMGIDLLDPSMIDRAPEELKSQVRKTLEERVAALKSIKGLEKQEQFINFFKAGFQESQDMLICRLENETKGLLLYNPCRIHPPMREWLESLGPVEYIVSGSSSHTNQLPQAGAAFPEAAIICSQAAEEKCVAVGMRPADYVYTDDESFSKAADRMGKAGVRLVPISGDTFTRNLIVVAHEHLFDVDLSCYGNGKRHLHVDQDEWDKATEGDIAYLRLLYCGLIHSAARSGYLPDMRLMGLDPTSPLNKVAVEEPNRDGSSCQEMANSIRKLLDSKDFSYVSCVHSRRKEPLPAAEYKIAVAAMWSWLDGESLLS